jgi:hypothetical protein
MAMMVIVLQRLGPASHRNGGVTNRTATAQDSLEEQRRRPAGVKRN